MSPAAAGTVTTAKDDKTNDSRKRKSVPSPATPTPKINKGSLHSELKTKEETEALSRETEKDAKLFSSIIHEVTSILKKIHEIKKSGKKTNTELTELKIKVCLTFVTLKKLNRLDKLRLRKCRDATQVAKQRVDSYHLILQNLRYEVMHLQKEVTKCIQFRSGDEDIELVSLDVFYSQAPTSVTNIKETINSEHALRKARLEWEMESRKALAEEKRKMETMRDKIESLIEDKCEKLNNLKPQLQTILEATKPVQSFLNMHLDEEKNQLATSKNLPRPLFVLFTQVRAYGHASDNLLFVDISGSEEEAKYVNERALLSESDVEEEDGEKKEEDDETLEPDKAPCRIAKASSKIDKRLKSLFNIHPLSVHLTLKQENGNDVKVSFSYCIRLEIILAKPQLTLNNDINDKDCSVLCSSSLLSHLIGYDSGMESPNPSTFYRLKKVNLKGIPSQFLDEYGYPYIWAQSMGGFNFLNVQNEKDIPLQIEDVINKIRSRLTSRMALQQQVSNLEKTKTNSEDFTIPDKYKSLFPERISSRIRNWSSVEYEQYHSLDVTQHFSSIVDPTDFIYRLQIDRDPAKLIALISIKPDYPITHPIFCLNLHWNGEYNIHNSENIRALEMEVNLSFLNDNSNIQIGTDILYLQIQKLMVCLDVMLEAWDYDTNESSSFPREKTFLQHIRGRNRALPLVYQNKFHIFSQR